MDETNKKENDFGLKDPKGDTVYLNNLDNVEQREPQDASQGCVGLDLGFCVQMKGAKGMDLEG